MHDQIRPRWRKVLRDAWLHKARTLLVVVAVAVGMIAAGALLDAWALVRRATLETYAATHPPSATLRIESGIDAALLAQVRTHPAIAHTRVRGRVTGSVLVDGTRYSAELFALQDFSARDIGAVDSARGTWPPRDGEISIEKSSLDFAGATLGQTVELQAGQAAQKLRISGVAHDVGLPPGWMDHVVYGFVTPATLASLEVSPALNELQFVVRDTSLDRAAVRSVANEIKLLLERNGVHVAHVEVPVPGEHPHAAQMDSLMFTQGAFGVLTLLVASFLIVNLITAMLAGQTREIGVMKALGASARQIAALYLVFALLLGMLASAIAVPAALAIGRPYGALKADMLNFSIDGFAIPWWAIALQVGAGCLLPVLAAAWPVARACRMRVAIALHDSGIAADHGAYLRRRITLPGVSRPLMLSIANAFRRRQRTVLTLLALAAGGAVFVGADNLRGSVLESVERMFAGQHYDVVLRLAAPHAARDIEAAAAHVDGVDKVQALLTDSATLTRADGSSSDAFTVLGVPPATPLFEASMEHGRWLDTHDTNALVVSERLLREEPQLRIDSDVTLTIGGKRSTWHIVGADRTVLQMIAYTPFATLAALHGDERASTLAVATRGGNAAAKLDVIMRLRSVLEQNDMRVAGSQLLSETRRAMQDHLLMVWQFLGAMAWVMIAVGGMGLASTMGIAVLERTREIGVLRAIGARHGAIMRMIQIEGLVIVVLAWLVSLPLSAPMSVLLANAFGQIMFPVPAHALPSTSAALTWLALVVGVSVLACAWPGRRAMRVPAATALSYQ
jgi:putative ABC transport system permease protein